MKRLFYLSTLLLITSNLFAQIPTNGLVAWYPFSGNANDNSGNNNNGTVSGATLTADRFGNPNSAYSFAGVNDYIEVSAKSGIFNSQTYTYSFWTKNSVMTGNSAFISKLNTSGDVYDNYCFFSSNGLANLNYLTVNNTMQSSAWDGQGPNMLGDVWKHIVISVGADSIRSYLNGVIVKKEKFVAPLNYNNNYPIRFGRTSHPFWDDYNGMLDDIRIYTRSLTQSEVNALYNETICYQTVSVADTLKISKLTGFNSIPDNFGTVKVYPNPTKNILNVDVSNPSNNYSIQITNSVGTVVYISSLNNSNTQINLSNLGSSGLYFINILDVSNNVLDTRKIVLE